MAPPSQPSTFRDFPRNFQNDVLSGFLVFLIALPLCLAISLASGAPATAGVFTAICGALISPWLSNSELTIKGPAAGLIVIVLGCIMEFAGGADATPEAQLRAYRLMLGVGVVAGAIQVAFALLRTGFVSEMFPTSAVHGMLAAIGVIIMSKQVHTMLGVVPHGKEPLHLLAEIPQSLARANPEIALIGISGLVFLFVWPLINFGFLKRIPAQLVVLVMGVVLAYCFDLDHKHTYTFAGNTYELSDKYLVNVPSQITSAITFPDFAGIGTPAGTKWIVMFALIGTLESLLSAKAVDLLDPLRRKTDYNSDLLAVGVGNTFAALIGGLPMISEIVRSKANIDNGARSRFANMFHGMFLLMFVAVLPWLIHRIPLAVLASMLVYTGFRLAHPREFRHMYAVGVDQLVVFVGTLVTVLATDLLVGVFTGVALKLAMHLFRGVGFSGFVRAETEIDEPDGATVRIRVYNCAVFSTWLSLRKLVLSIDRNRKVVLDLTHARFVDHTVMEKLHVLRDDFLHEGRRLEIIGLDDHRPMSRHPLAARSKLPDSVRPPSVGTQTEPETGTGEQVPLPCSTPYECP